jgi:alpha-L-rhamnosidase
LQVAIPIHGADDGSHFRSAKPIWPAGRETEMNLSVGFVARIAAPEAGTVQLRIATASIYRLHINGRFLACGPARGPHGFYRVDLWDLTDQLQPGENAIAIEVPGYNSNSYYLLDQPSFLQAEASCAERVLASTAGDGASFDAVILEDRLQKVQRYSFQRPFIEAYALQPGWDRWRMGNQAAAQIVDTAVQTRKRLLPRRVLYPTFTVRKPVACGPHGTMKRVENVPRIWRDRSLVNIGPELKGYPEDQLAVVPTVEAQHYTTRPKSDAWRSCDGDTELELGPLDYQLLDLGTNLTGFFGMRIDCRETTRLWLMFDEILGEDGDVNWRRLGCCNIVEYRLEPGSYQVETIEPYTARYLKLFCVAGACSVRDVLLREYAYPEVTGATFEASDERLNELFAAGVETFRQNSLDIFMDCPSRERAGWLCDSFFTARVEHDLSDVSRVEHNFVENFLLPDRFEHLPDGIFPMCYPADHYNGNFIPNWAMWFVVQLEEYLARSGDRATVDALRPKVMKLLEYFQPFENSDGLLESLEKWVFVEWSAANKFVQDVNYPSNMLYAGTLAAAGRMYDVPDLIEKAARIRETIRGQSFDGQFFVDNAVRTDGGLRVTENRSEVCQYFAMFFDVASPASHPQLWTRLRDQFGPDRKETGAFAEVHLANSFIGNMLRMELLSREGHSQQILDESIAYLLYMAQRTGTLWEHTGPQASCNHGFASHIVHTLYRDVLGLYRIDSVDKTVLLRFGDLELEQCQGRVPTPDGPVELAWHKLPGTIVYRVAVPQGYALKIENSSGCELVAETD